MDKRMAATLYGEAKIMRGDLEKIQLGDSGRAGFSGSGISAFIPPFNDLLLRTQAAVAQDPIAAQSLGGITQARQIAERLSRDHHMKAKSALMIGLGRIIAALEPFLNEASVTVRMTATREGVFFGGEYYEPLRLTADLINQARQSIVIIDGYLGNGQTVLNLLTGKASGVAVKLLSYEDKLEPSLLTLAQAFKKEHGSLSLRTSRAFHDRFFIIDDADFYHFGASLKDMGTRGFMFSRIEEPEVIEKIRTKFHEEWAKATVKI